MKPKVEEVLSEITDQWMNVRGVEGIGQGKIGRKDCILVYINMETPEIEKTIPKKIKGFTVKLKKSGGITAQKHAEKTNI